MSLIDVSQWNSEQVFSWIKGLDDAVALYANQFLNNGIDGKRLLILDHHSLDKLGVTKLGHQELLLEAIELLNRLCYQSESETVQSLSLALSTRSRQLLTELQDAHDCNDQVPNSLLLSVSYLMTASKALISWLDRYPFDDDDDFWNYRNHVVNLSLEITTYIHPEKSSSSLRPNWKEHISKKCQKLIEYCEDLVQRSRDPIVCQPVYFEIAVIKRHINEEWGMHIQSSYLGTHIISSIYMNSPADKSDKLEAGDEIIQVNGQTILGWPLKKLVAALREHSTEVILTLKKQPLKHDVDMHTTVKPKRVQQKTYATLPRQWIPTHKRMGSEPQHTPASELFAGDSSNKKPGSGDMKAANVKLAKNVMTPPVESGEPANAPFITITGNEDDKDLLHVGGIDLDDDGDDELHLTVPIVNEAAAAVSIFDIEGNADSVVESTQQNAGISEMSPNNVDSDTSTNQSSEVPFQSYVVRIVGGIPQRTPVGQESKPGKISDMDTTKPKHREAKSFIRKKRHGSVGNRRVSCQDLGKGDCEGWLYKWKEQKGLLGSRWTKRWCILKNQNLYYYAHEKDDKAEGVLYMPGFNISPAPELKTTKYAFKAHHPGTTFYFAAERQEDVTKWMNKMGLAAINFDASKIETTSGFNKLNVLEKFIFYSESEESLTDISPMLSRSTTIRTSNDSLSSCGSAASSPAVPRKAVSNEEMTSNINNRSTVNAGTRTEKEESVLGGVYSRLLPSPRIGHRHKDKSTKKFTKSERKQDARKVEKEKRNTVMHIVSKSLEADIDTIAGEKCGLAHNPDIVELNEKQQQSRTTKHEESSYVVSLQLHSQTEDSECVTLDDSAVCSKPPSAEQKEMFDKNRKVKNTNNNNTLGGSGLCVEREDAFDIEMLQSSVTGFKTLSNDTSFDSSVSDCQQAFKETVRADCVKQKKMYRSSVSPSRVSQTPCLSDRRATESNVSKSGKSESIGSDWDWVHPEFAETEFISDCSDADVFSEEELDNKGKLQENNISGNWTSTYVGLNVSENRICKSEGEIIMSDTAMPVSSNVQFAHLQDQMTGDSQKTFTEMPFKLVRKGAIKGRLVDHKFVLMHAAADDSALNDPATPLNTNILANDALTNEEQLFMLDRIVDKNRIGANTEESVDTTVKRSSGQNIKAVYLPSDSETSSFCGAGSDSLINDKISTDSDSTLVNANVMHDNDECLLVSYNHLHELCRSFSSGACLCNELHDGTNMGNIVGSATSNYHLETTFGASEFAEPQTVCYQHSGASQSSSILSSSDSLANRIVYVEKRSDFGKCVSEPFAMHDDEIPKPLHVQTLQAANIKCGPFLSEQHELSNCKRYKRLGLKHWNCETVKAESSDDLVQLAKKLDNAEITVDGVDRRVQRASSLRNRKSRKNRRSELMLSLKAMERTLKDKENELQEINQLLAGNISSRRLHEWAQRHEDLVQNLSADSAQGLAISKEHVEHGTSNADRQVTSTFQADSQAATTPYASDDKESLHSAGGASAIAEAATAVVFTEANSVPTHATMSVTFVGQETEV